MAFESGTRIRTLVADADTDELGEYRYIPVGTIGVIGGEAGGLYDIAWDGGSTRWTREELERDAVLAFDRAPRLVSMLAPGSVMMSIQIDAATLRQMAHAAVLHYESLKKKEGSLPPTEVATLKAAQQLEISAMTVLAKEASRLGAAG